MNLKKKQISGIPFKMIIPEGNHTQTAAARWSNDDNDISPKCLCVDIKKQVATSKYYMYNLLSLLVCWRNKFDVGISRTLTRFVDVMCVAV